MTRLPLEAMVVVRRPAPGGGEVLLLHRSPARQAYWHLVAGALEPGEGFDEAARRELLEETGLRTQRLRPLGLRYLYPLAEEPPWSRARYAAGVEQVDVRCFAADAPVGWEPALDEEHDAYRWSDADGAAVLLRWP